MAAPSTGGVSSRITNLALHGAKTLNRVVWRSTILAMNTNHGLTGKACEEYDPSYGDVYVEDGDLKEKKDLESFKCSATGQYKKVASSSCSKEDSRRPGTQEQTANGVTVDSRENLCGGAHGNP